ncbi:MAG TPA: sugar phosphate isomerase/epimerase [Burkholderiaceae bacterium]|nr:sugar phosphate isomerase/epimerase [Burkholderiaceae bacterium]
MSQANDDDRANTPARRTFLKSAAAATAAVPALMSASATPAFAHDGEGRGRSIPRESISIQLYTLRELSLEATLQGLAAIGYRKVEHAGFGNRTAAEFRAALQQAGLRASSGHQAIPQPWNDSAWYQQVADAVAVGQQSIVTPLSPITVFPTDGDVSKIKGLTTVDAWQRYAQDLNRAGAIARSAGLRFGFHNHFWEFAALDDDTPQVGYDILLAETDPRLVHFEVDLYWAWFAHRDPVQLIAYAGDRIRQFHVKDMRFVDRKATFADAGTGVIDFARIFRAAGKTGEHEYIIERDDAGAAALSTARIGYDFLTRVKL